MRKRGLPGGGGGGNLRKTDNAVRMIRMLCQLFEQVLGHVSRQGYRDIDDFARVQRREVTEEFHRAWRLQQLGAHDVQLGDDAEDVEVDAECEQEVPQLQHFG